MQYRLIDNTEDFLALESEWDTLLRKSRVDHFFLSWTYLSTWWKVYGDCYDLRIGTARDANGELKGIAPFVRGKGDVRGRKWLRHLGFMGTLGDAAAEFLDFIIEEGHEAELAPHLFRLVAIERAAEWDLVQLRQVHSQSPNLHHVLPLFAELGSTSLRVQSTPSPFLPLIGTVDELIKSKSKNFRKQFNNPWNRLHKNHEIEIVEAGKDIKIEEAFQILIELNDNRWGEEGQAFQSRQFNQLQLRLAEQLIPTGGLYFQFLKVDGKYAATRFDFIYNQRMLSFQGGWSQDFSQFSIGRLFLAMTYRWCVDQGITEYDFLGGDATYKRSWATGLRTLMDVEAFNPQSGRATLFQQARVLKSLFDPRPLNPIPSV